MAVDVAMERWLLLATLILTHWVWGVPSIDSVIVVASCWFFCEVTIQRLPPNKFLAEIQDQSNVIRKLCYEKRKMAEDFFILEGMVRRRRNSTSHDKEAARACMVVNKSF